MEISRATERSAIVASLLSGRGSRPRGASKPAAAPQAMIAKTARTLTTSFFTGYIGHSFPGVELLVHRWMLDNGGAPKLGIEISADRHGPKRQQPLSVDVIAAPLDGARDLVQGYSGSLSCGAAVAPGGLQPFGRELALNKTLLLAVANPDVLTEDAMADDGITNASDLVRSLVNAVSSESGEPPIRSRHGLTGAGIKCHARGNELSRKVNQEIHQAMQDAIRMRMLPGSSILAAMRPIILAGETDLFVGAIRGVHALLIALLAASRNTPFVAYSLDKSGNVTGGPLSCDEFVKPDADFIVTLTGVTGSRAVNGVERQTQSTVRTCSRWFRRFGNSGRLVYHDHDLLNKRFYRLVDNNVETLPFNSVLEAVSPYIPA